MKKFNKYISLSVVALMAAGFAASCDDSKDNDFVQEYDGPGGIYFSNTESAYLELSDDANTIVYRVYRDQAGPELTVNIAVTPTQNYSTNPYTFPSSVTFEAGSKVADYVIGYDISKTTIGEEQQYQLVLDAEPNPFASNSVIITLVNPAPWTLLGIGDYYDYGFFVDWEGNTGPVKVQVYQQGLDKNIFRISNPYIELNGDENAYFEFRLLQEGDRFMNVNITVPDLVGYTMFYMMYWEEDKDDIYIAFPGYFFDNISSWVNNRVLEYQDNGLPGIIQIAPVYYLYNTGDGYNASVDPYIYINFPDYVSLDTSLNVSYEGILTNSEQTQEVLLSVNLGADISEARAAVTAGRDASELIQQLEEGSIDYTEFKNSGNVKIPFGNENPTGYYTAAVVAFADGQAKASGSVEFLYISTSTDYDPNEGWNSLGYVDYTDGYVCACPILFLPDPIQTYSLEIQESEDTPGLYRLVNPYGAAYRYSNVEEDNPYMPYYLYINASDPNYVTILESPQNLILYAQDDENSDPYAAATLNSCWSLAESYLAAGNTREEIEAAGAYFGKYANDVISFPNAFIANFQGQQFLQSALIGSWEMAGVSEEDNGYYSANLVMDYNIYQSSNGEEIYMLNPDGTFYAPFKVDMSTLTQTANYRQNGHVMLTSKATMYPQSRILKMQKMVKAPIEKNSKTQQVSTLSKNRTSIQRRDF